MQHARQVAWTLVERDTRVRFLIRDCDSKLTGSFEPAFESRGRACGLDASSGAGGEQNRGTVVRTVRAECLEWVLIV